MSFLIFTSGCGSVAYELEAAPDAAALAHYNSDEAWAARGADGTAEARDEAPDEDDGLEGPPAPATAEEAAAMLDGRVDPFTGERA